MKGSRLSEGQPPSPLTDTRSICSAVRVQVHTTRGQRLSQKCHTAEAALGRFSDCSLIHATHLAPASIGACGIDQPDWKNGRRSEKRLVSGGWGEGGCLPGSGLAELNTLSRWARAAYLSARAELTSPPAAVGLLCDEDRAKDPKSALHDLGKRSKCAKVAPASPAAAPPPALRRREMGESDVRVAQVGAGGRSQTGGGVGLRDCHHLEEGTQQHKTSCVSMTENNKT